MDALGWAGEDRACLGSVVANSDDIIEGVVEEFVEVFRTMVTDVKTALAHGLDSKGIDMGGLVTCAKDSETLAAEVP